MKRNPFPNQRERVFSWNIKKCLDKIKKCGIILPVMASVPLKEMAVIKQKLEDFEKTSGARVLFASVGGSIAYGLNSKSSDVDVKFVYVYPKDKYLCVESPAEHANLGDDVNGYELRHFLKLVRKSVWNIFEMVESPYIIIGEENLEAFKKVVYAFFNRKALVKSMYGMAYETLKKYTKQLEEDDILKAVKLILYALKMNFSALYISLGGLSSGFPPINFIELMEAVKYRNNIPVGLVKKLVAIKTGKVRELSVNELKGLANSIYDELEKIEGKFAMLDITDAVKEKPNAAILDEFFKKFLA